MTLVKFKNHPTALSDLFMPNNMGSFFDDFFGSDAQIPQNSFFTPSVDIVENNNSYDIQLALPGMKKEDIRIEMKGDDLVISGESLAKRTEEKGKVHLSELNYGSFSRSFYMPENIDKDHIEANYQDGILHLTLPKGELAKAKTISVK